MLDRIDSLFINGDIFITNIEVKVVTGCNVDDLEFPTASFVSTGFCIIFLHTDIGIIGLGEPSPYGGDISSTINAVKEINDDLKGKSLYDAWLYKAFDGELLSTGYGGLAKQAVVAAVSQCCIDILGKQLNIPAYKIFNPEATGTVLAYASGGMIYDNQSLDLYVQEALKSQEKGFNAWKFRPSTPKGLDHFQRNNTPPALDINSIKRTIECVSSACGDDFEILLDVGCRCRDMDEAKELCNFSTNYNVGFIEEPLPRNIELYSKLISKTKAKISTGETFFSSEQFELWAKDSAIDIFQPDVNLVGIREIIKIFLIAKKYNKKIVFHNWANAISNIANISLASAIPDLCKYVESSIVYNPFREKFIGKPLLPKDGRFSLSDSQGLGI